MADAKGKQKNHRHSPHAEELVGATSIGKHYFCGGEVYFVPHRQMGYRYCDKCKTTNRKGGVLHLACEAALWK